MFRSARTKLIFDYMRQYPSEEGKKAKAAYKISNLITSFIIWLMLIPTLSFVLFLFAQYTDNFVQPTGTRKVIYGDVMDNGEQFVTYQNGKMVEYNISDYEIRNKLEPGDNVIVYLGTEDLVILVAKQIGFRDVKDFLLNLVIIALILVAHAIMSKKVYCSAFYKYAEMVEIELFHDSGSSIELMINTLKLDTVEKVRAKNFTNSANSNFDNTLNNAPYNNNYNSYYTNYNNGNYNSNYRNNSNNDYNNDNQIN